MSQYTKLDDSAYLQELDPTATDESVNTDKVLFSPEEKLSFHGAVKRWPKVALYSLGLTSTIILWGYDSALVGSVAGMPEFKKVYGTQKEGQDIIPAVWLALWNISSPIGSIAGALVSGWLGDKIGRRLMLGSSTLFVGVSVAICLISDLPPTINGRCAIFFLAKMIQGIAIGSIIATTQTWMSEAVPEQLKASVLAMFPVFQLVGQIIGSIIIQIQLGVEGRSGYRVAFATQFAFGLPPLIMSYLLPESPAWLLRKGRLEKALVAFRSLVQSKSNRNISASFARLQETIALESQRSRQDRVTYLQCFKGTDLRRTMIVIFAGCVPDAFGLNLVGNATYFLQTIGITARIANLIFITGIAVCLASIISSFWTLTMFRRRQLFISTLSVITVIWGSIGIIGCTKQEKLIQWYTCISFVLLTMTAGLGVWPASYVVAGETSSLRLRARAQGIGWASSGAFSAVIGVVMPYVYNPDAGNLGAQSGFVYLGLAGMATVISFLFLPEMKGRSAAEIDEMFELRLPARQFKMWRKD